MPGGLGDLLGRIGEQLNIGPYKNRQRNAAIADGIEQMQSDPLMALAQISRQDPEIADAIYKNFTTARNGQEKNRIDASRTEAQNAVDYDKRDAQTQQYVSQFIDASNPQTWDKMKERISEMAARRGYTGPLDLPDTYEEGFGQRFRQRIMDAKDREQLAENIRNHDIQDTNRDDDRLVNAQLGNARVQASLAGQATSRANTQTREAGATGRAATAETGRNDRARATATNGIIARVVKNNPGATVQTNRTTGKVRYSTDGGKTWNMAN